MKRKLFFTLFLVAIAMYGFQLVLVWKQHEPMSNLMLANIDALAQKEGGSDHGNVDTTLEPYYRQGSKTIWMELWGEWKSTVIPCCESVSSQWSGCAKGLDRC
ncbi:MAG: NVEALA domain-containing protein [Cellulosilyticaceae bacterium]